MNFASGAKRSRKLHVEHNLSRGSPNRFLMVRLANDHPPGVGTDMGWVGDKLTPTDPD